LINDLCYLNLILTYWSRFWHGHPTDGRTAWRVSLQVRVSMETKFNWKWRRGECLTCLTGSRFSVLGAETPEKLLHQRPRW